VHRLASIASAVLAAAAATSPAAPVPAAPAAARMEAQAEEILAALREEHSVRAARSFDAALRADLPPPRLTAGWRALMGALGRPGAATLDRAASGPAHLEYDLALERGRVRLALDFSSRGEVTALAFHRPLAGASAQGAARAVEVAAGQPPLTVRGTLTLPRAQGKVAAALLVGDLGADREGAHGGSARPLRDLADALAARGIASLRLERRSAEYPDHAALATPESEVLADAARALRLLRDRPEVDAARVYVVGHGLGGVLAGEVARRGGPVAAVALVGAPYHAYPLALLEAARAPGALAPGDRAREESLGERALAGTLEDDVPFHGYGGAFWRDLAGRDAAGVLRRLGRPVLVVRGEKDAVARAEDVRGWEAALAGAERVRFETLPGVDHDLAAAGGGAPAARRVVELLVEATATAQAEAGAGGK
jgi:dienelactone hydrolase